MNKWCTPADDRANFSICERFLQEHDGITIGYTKEVDLNIVISAKRTHRLDNEGVSGDALVFFLRDPTARDLLSNFFGRALGSTQLMKELNFVGFVKAKEPGKILPSKTREILRMSWFCEFYMGSRSVF